MKENGQIIGIGEAIVDLKIFQRSIPPNLSFEEALQNEIGKAGEINSIFSTHTGGVTPNILSQLLRIDPAIQCGYLQVLAWMSMDYIIKKIQKKN